MNIRVHFMDGASMEINAVKSLRALSEALIALPYKTEPLKFVSISTGKQFYFDFQVIQAFLAGELDEMELVRKLECHGLYRNTSVLKMSDFEIEIDSLFKRIDDKLILIDDDRFVSVHYPDSDFIEV